MDLQLYGKRALVTGSTGGIGAGIAKRLAEEGAAVVVHGRDADRARKVVHEITAAGGRAAVALGEITSDADALRVIDEATQAFGGTDILVSNAGYDAESRTWDEIPPADWIEIYDTNTVSTVRFVRPLLGPMRKAGWGRIVLISSGVATMPLADQPNYAASKAALVNMTVGLTKHLAGTGVTVNTVSPGFILTPGARDRVVGTAKALGWTGGWEEIQARMIREILPIPAGRPGTVEEVAALVAFVASPLAGFISGSNLRIDGGSTPTVN